MSEVSIYLGERVDEDEENVITKRLAFEDSDLLLDDVIMAMEQALKGFGFLGNNKCLKVVDEDD